MKILYLSPHTDDVELSCAGYIIKHSNYEHIIITWSDCDVYNIDKEHYNAGIMLNLKSNKLCSYKRRTFNEHRQEILDYLINQRIKLQPDIVFMPHPSDTHQDHQVISNEGIRAFKKHCDIIFYPTHNITDFAPNYYVQLSQKQVKKKIEVLKCYKSQQEKRYFEENNIIARMLLAGEHRNIVYAEAFQTYSVLI